MTLPETLTQRLKELLEKYGDRTFCLSCGYDGDDIQGDYPDLYDGYGCPKCHSPFVVKIKRLCEDIFKKREE